ncbi:MAG TPA: hypothetical protein VF125_07150 [Solirubrobacterales bacterium]
MEQIRKRLTYANVVSTLALFVALGLSSAYAANQLGKNSVGPKQLKKGAVTAAKLKPGAVTTAKLADGAVTGEKVREETLGKVPAALQADRAVQAGNADSLGGLAASRYLTGPTEPVRLVGTPGNPDFNGSWKNFGPSFAPAGFYKDQFGIVHLQGLVDPPGFAGAIFRLPEGYLPDQSYNFTYFGAMADSKKIVPIQLEVDGDVTAATSDYSESLSLDGITFRAAQ